MEVPKSWQTETVKVVEIDDYRETFEWAQDLADLVRHYELKNQGEQKSMKKVTEEDEVQISPRLALDGAKTLAEAAQLAHELGEYLEDLEEQGYELYIDIMDDLGVATPGGIVPIDEDEEDYEDEDESSYDDDED